MTGWTWREERAGDAAAIAAVTTAAFLGHPYSSGTEAAIVDGLRAAGALDISHVAVDAAGAVIGHVAFSPVAIGEATEGWFGLGPLSVSPDHQRLGIGSALARAGLDRLRAIGAKGCVVLGAAAYYRRFGFENDATVKLAGPPPEHFMVLWLGEQRAAGEVRFHAAFGG